MKRFPLIVVAFGMLMACSGCSNSPDTTYINEIYSLDETEDITSNISKETLIDAGRTYCSLAIQETPSPESLINTMQKTAALSNVPYVIMPTISTAATAAYCPGANLTDW